MKEIEIDEEIIGEAEVEVEAEIEIGIIIIEGEVDQKKLIYVSIVAKKVIGLMNVVFHEKKGKKILF